MTTTVYVVTPSFNAVGTIDRTIQSVLSQAGDVRVRYHVQDGGSTDGTVERLKWWQERLAAGTLRRQCQGIRFTYASERDAGMYDALVRGFSAVEASTNAFMTWINADDILMPGALACAGAMEQQFSPLDLSWFGGAVCIVRDDMITQSFDRPVPREALRRGFCDGKHWDFLRQEGTFFRKWLWEAANPATTIAGMKLAGDWNLWRLMAARADFSQLAVPLGGFRISEGQLSASQRDGYRNEVEAIKSDEARKGEFEKFCAAAPVVRKRIKATRGSVCDIILECIDGFARHRYVSVFGAVAPWGKRSPLPEKTVAHGKVILHVAVEPEAAQFPDIALQLEIAPGRIALDHRCLNSERGPHAADHVADGNADAGRAGLLLASQAHQTGHSLRDLVDPRPAAIGTGGAEGGDRGEDQPRIAHRQRRIVHLHVGHGTGLEVFDQNIGLVGQRTDQFQPRGVAKVHR